MRTNVFTVADIRTIVRDVGIDGLMDEVIARLTEVCKDFDPDAYAIPVRGGFDYRCPDLGLLEWMPALEISRSATLKVVGYHPANPRRRALPSILSTTLSFDTSSGHLAALMDGTFATALRTGAASAVASRVLAARDSRVLGLVGCGAQAVTQLHGLSRVFDLDQVLVYDIEAGAAASFAGRVKPLGLDSLDIRVVPLAVLEACSDIICTATSVDPGMGPVMGDECLKPAVHVNAVGSDFPGKTELPPSLLRRSLVCPDFPLQALREGECQQLQAAEIGPQLVELVTDAARYRRARTESTVFDSTGWALEDHIVLEILAHHGRRLGCGAWLEIECCPHDPRSPYELVYGEQAGKAASGQPR